MRRILASHSHCFGNAGDRRGDASEMAARFDDQGQLSPTLRPAGMLECLRDLKTKGILTQEEFDAKKAELLKKLV